MYSEEVLDPMEAEDEISSREDSGANDTRKNEGFDSDTSAPVVDSEKLALQELCGGAPLTKEEEAKYFEQIRMYEEGSPEWMKAYHAIILGNMRMVVKIVGEKYTNSITPPMGFWDMVHEGVFAIDKCIRKFDVTKGHKFSTYAYPAISRDIMRAIAAKGTALSSIGANQYSKMRRTLAIKNTLMTETGTQSPSIEDIAAKAGYDVNKVREYMRLSSPVLSLDQTIRNETDDTEDAELLNFISDESVDVEAVAIDNADSEKIKEYAREYLDARAYTIIEARYFRNPPVPISELAEQLGCTPQNIYTIKCSALTLLGYLLKNEGEMPPWRGETVATAASSAATQEQKEGDLF